MTVVPFVTNCSVNNMCGTVFPQRKDCGRGKISGVFGGMFSGAKPLCRVSPTSAHYRRGKQPSTLAERLARVSNSAWAQRFPNFAHRRTSGAVRRALRANERIRKTPAGVFLILSFRQPSAAADGALIGAEAEAMHSPFPCGKGDRGIGVKE